MSQMLQSDFRATTDLPSCHSCPVALVLCLPVCLNVHLNLDLRVSRRWLWITPFSWMLLLAALITTYVSEERSSSIIRVTRIGELGKTLAVTSNRHTLLTFLAHLSLSLWCWRSYFPPIRRFLQEPHCVTSQKTAFLNAPSFRNTTGFRTE
jgi:hypothetical protein